MNTKKVLKNNGGMSRLTTEKMKKVIGTIPTSLKGSWKVGMK
jgi:hypothetical protein